MAGLKNIMAGLKKARRAAAKAAAQKAKQSTQYQTRVMHPANQAPVASPFVMTTGDAGKP